MIGTHLSITNPISDLPKIAHAHGMGTFQFFLRNNRNMKMRQFTRYELCNFRNWMECFEMKSVVVHAAYTLNPCDYQQRYVDAIKEDLAIVNNLGGHVYYVLHPGSANHHPLMESLDNLLRTCNEIKGDLGCVELCLETMAGQGSQVMSTISDVQLVLQELPWTSICFDTCHVYAAGLDVNACLTAWRNRIGVLHLNGSKTAFGSRVDRHAPVIGNEQWLNIAKYWVSQMPDQPLILETPDASILNDFSWVDAECKKFMSAQKISR